jgi:hypothetical protein
MITNALDKNMGIDLLGKAIDTVRDGIEKSGGTLTVKMKVYIKKLFFVSYLS